MDFSSHIPKDNLHHAYLIEGGEEIFTQLREFVEVELGETISGNPDIHLREFETLGIDEARELTLRAHKKAFGERKMFLCRAETITREAQNSLLKLLEEPPKDTHFFICTPRATHLIPTLRSRVWLIEASGSTSTDARLPAGAFLKANPAERLEMIEPLLKDKDIEGAQTLLENIEKELYESNTHKRTKDTFAHLYEVKSLIRNRGASAKQLLESVALLLPVQAK